MATMTLPVTCVTCENETGDVVDEIKMPEGTHLAYVVMHEVRHVKHLPTSARFNEGRPTIEVSASAQGNGGGVDWEFGIEDMSGVIGKPALRLKIFDEGWEAFTCMVPFFAALADRKGWTLAEVRALLDELGAVDETDREDLDSDLDDDKF